MTSCLVHRTLPVASRTGSIMSAASKTVPRRMERQNEATGAAVGNGAAGLMPAKSAKTSGAERIIATSSHPLPSLAANWAEE